ncbi:Dual specificity protein phosphatase 12 [Tetrabaena socialis]|uniref:Dual specificity protein phosphatase 12 n=1 Tax=Tetrabaena socialis TaxID=47790 RepID=A0A2J8AJI8_9CHLO|nr:Dual specificity protein phosphatase 12 [Tetrabaena socialis]|eukprot:PNH12686.1 Dual specificity protein phosphatase 12 [Tetrabaena socialis]
MQLQEGEGEGEGERSEGGSSDGDSRPGDGSPGRRAGLEEEGAAGAAARAAGGQGASTSKGSSAAGGPAPGRAQGKAPPRNFVAEYEAAAAAKGPATGPRVSYACRGCRSVLFTEADTEPHGDHERALFAASKPRKKGAGKHGNDAEGSSLCSMHFLRKPLAWMETCLEADGPQAGEGKLLCPTCSAKLGKWAAGAGAAGVQCSCSVRVPPPAYALLKARLDIVDTQLDIASAVQSTLKAYEEEGAAGGAAASSSDDGGMGTRKKRQKQKRNKAANFSSFRNKTFGVSQKQQRQGSEAVAEE